MKKHILWLLALLWSVTAVGETITVARALEICGGLASGVSTTESYTIEGYVNKIASNDFNSTYNNMRFWIADTKGSASTNANGALLVYRGRPDVELQVGDKVSVTSTLINYNGTTYETNTTNCPVTLLYRPTVLTERDTTYGSLRICAQNLENYYINSNTGRGNFTQAEINAKTSKIVNMMLTINADIYAFCEVEAKPEVLTYLANAANSAYGANVFVAVSDGIDVDWDATLNNNIKSGFIYRSDRVAPVGSNNAIYSANYYCNTMRYQAFQQLSNGEKLVVSMNHFKAKDSSSDQGESTRLTNANRLVNTLSTVTTDPDILILGDLNCQYGEAPITYIMNAGYAEQILRFDSTNYSHCYGGGELIDHVIANSSMEQQIVDAYVRHLSTTCSTGVTSDMSYSDHDPYVVEINLSSSTTPSSITTCAAAAQAALSVSANNELYNNGATYTIRGYVTAIQTAYNSSYGNITFWMADTQNGGKVLEAYRCSADASAVPNVGDYVEVTGNLTKYGSTPEFASGCSCQVIYTSAPPVNLGAKTIYEFLQLKNVKDTCVLTGIVENIVMDSEDTTQYNKFGNFYINDGTGSLYIYGLLTADGQTQQFRTMGIDEGDTLTLKAVYAEYNSNPQAANAIYVSHSKFVSTNWGPVTVKLDPSSTTMNSWNQVGIWAWVTNGTKSTDLFEQWPGVQVTKDITGWWSYTFENIPEGQLNIIWNDFGSYGYQTDDIENVAENTCYRLPSYSYSHEVVDCPTTHDTIFLYSVANYIDFQALSAAYPAMTATTITSTNTYTLPNGSVLRGWLNPETSAEASNTWNVKENYNTVMPTPEMNGVEALRAGTMFRAASHTSISLGAFNMPTDGKLTVYFQPNGDSNRGVSITVGDNTYDFMKSGVKIDNIRPAYAAEVDLPASYYMKGSVVITALSNTINIFGVRISPEPEVVLSNDLTVAEAITLGNQLGNNTLSEDSVSVIGYVISVSDFDMAFGNQSFYIADAPNGEQTMQAYRAIPMKDGALYPVLVGDLVRIKGKLQHYVNNNTGEDFAELLRPSVTFINEAAGDRSLPAIPEISVADALQYGYSMEVGYRTSTTYDIVGYVTNIEEDAMDTYGNMTFWIADETNGASSNAEGGLYIFRGIPDRRLQTGDMVRVRSYIRHTAVTESSSIVQTASSAGVMYLGHPAANVPTTQDLMMAGYNIINNIVLCFHFGDEPCNDVVIAGNYNGWTTEPSECVRMSPLAGFDGWYAAQIPYNTNGGTWDNQAKPVQLANDGSFNWEYQAGDVNAWIHRGGNETEFESFTYECTPYLSNPGAYIYEISYWKNHNNPCNEIKSNYDVYLSAPQNAPSNIELIGSFDNWTGTPMTYDAQFGYWTATITATPSDYFMFREAGTWDNQILVYDSVIDDWTVLNNCMIGDYIISDAIVYADFSNPNTYRWTTSGSGSDTSAVTDPIELTIASITSNFYTEDNDIWYRLNLEDEENNFAIDIIVPQGMRDVELGHVYTWSDMLQQYCQGYYNSQTISYSDVQFVKIQTANGVQISALITATNGQQYILTYVGADATPFDYDADYAYTENFSGYNDVAFDTAQRRVYASNTDNAYINMLINLPTGIDTLVAGTYPINATGNPMTVKASEGFVSGITPSFAGYINSEGYIDTPIWYLVSGTVIVDADGTITVNALNSKGYAVQSQLTKAQVQPSDAPTVADLENAGYDTDNNVVLAYKFDVAPCYDVVVAGTYMMDSAGNWITDPSQLVHMMPLAGFNGWYAAQIPYTEYSVQAKPVQLSDIGAFNWDNQAGDVNAWIHRGGNEAYIVSGYDNEVNVSYESPGAYIYEIAYWKNNNNPCTSQTTTYTVFLEAPQNAPDSIEIIGSFDNWMGTLMTYDAQTGYWTATITATPSDVFKFRQAGNWGNEILVYNSAYDEWTTLPNLVISQYLYDNIVYLDFDNAELYRWTKQDDESAYYIPYNLQAVSVPGRVEFSWDVDVVSDQYKLHIYDVNSTAAYFLTIYGTSTYVYAVEDFLDGMEFRWSVEPISPYDLDEVFADSTIVMHKSEVELSGFNLTTVDSITLDLTWQSNKENLLYRVEVDYNGSIIREETVNLKEYHFTSKLPGWHQVYVQPLNADGEAVGRYTYAGEINLARVPEPFSNLQGAANEHELTFTWNKVVDSVYVQIFRMVDGEFSDYIYHAPTAGNSMVYTVNEDGNYALQLRAYLEIRPGQYGTVDYAKYITVQAFSVPTYSIQIDAAEGGYIWPDLSGEYPLGYTLKAYAYPYEGYRFVGWNDGNTDQERTITVQGAMSITALFEALDSYTVTVQASEGGQVYVSYLGDYTTLYSETLYEGTYIQLQARPVDGYAFYQWSDGVTDAIRYITVNADVNLTAIFMPYRHLTVAVNDALMGKVTVTGDYDFADGVYTAAHGAALTLIAQPNEGYHFAGWSDGVQTVQRIVNMTEDKSLTAIFAVNTAPVVQYNITVSATDGGSVNDVSGTYNSGDMIELIATPMEGYEFVRWSDGVTTNPRPMTVSENKELTAIFQIRTFTVTILAGQGGTVSGQVSGTYNYGTTISFAAAANEHYRFTGWSDGNTDIERSITLVKDTVITASFAAIPLYTLNLTAGQGGQIRVNNEPYTTTFNRAYEENTSVVIEAAANANYIFSRWSDGNTNAIRYVPMNSDISLTAEFLPIYTLTIIANNGSVLVQGDAEATANNVYKAVAGTVLTLTAQPAEGYRFVSWSDGVQTISRDITLTSATFLVATFEVAASTPQYTVTVGITGTGTGTVNGQTSISTLYYENDQVPLTALAGESSEFVGWSDGVTTASRTLVVSSDTLVIAIFNFVEPTVQYTVTFKNYDGTILESKKWNEGETPTCSVTPTHPDDEANTYSFIGWTPEIVPVTADAVYTAVFEATPVVLPSFTVTFYDWDDTVLSQQSVTKGENATPPQTPTRAGYVFTGWDGNYTNVQHDEAVFATYKPAEEALEDVLDGNNAVKIFREGQIFILRGDKTYTLDGQIVR